jgi:hypothetical protein
MFPAMMNSHPKFAMTQFRAAVEPDSNWSGKTAPKTMTARMTTALIQNTGRSTGSVACRSSSSIGGTGVEGISADSVGSVGSAGGVSVVAIGRAPFVGMSWRSSHHK